MLKRGEYYLHLNIKWDIRSWRTHKEDIAYFLSGSKVSKELTDKFKRTTRLSVDDFATAFYNKNLVEDCRNELLKDPEETRTPEYMFLDRIRKERPFRIVDFARKNAKEIALWAEKLGVDTLRAAVEDCVIREARGDYEHILLDRAYAEHLGYNTAFSYAVHNGVFTPKQVGLVNFDGQTVVQYCNREGGKNLVDDLTKVLLNPPPKPEYKDTDNDPHPVCDCCH